MQSPDVGIKIEIVCAWPQRSVSKLLLMQHGASVSEALALAAQDSDFSGVDLQNSPVGIFGKQVARDHRLKQGDRIEIYRPLAEEPKLARRKRVSRSART
jgi:uncharacterized protein